MRNILNDIEKSNKLAAFYINKENTEVFLVGKVFLVGTADVFIILYDQQNHSEAICYCDIGAIYRIEQNSLYLQDIQDLEQDNFALLTHIQQPWELFFEANVQRNNVIYCTLKDGASFTGELKDYSQDHVALLQTDGKQTICTLNQKDIASLIVDMVYDRGV